VAIARGNEKGRVERAIKYIRGSFFAGRTFVDLDDLNTQADAWCRGIAADRRCPGDESKTVREAFAEEAPRLLGVPDNPYPLYERIPVIARKTPYVRFDLNDYSIPHTHVGRTLTLTANLAQVRILDGKDIIASHVRSYDRRAQVEDLRHIEELAAHKRAARRHRATDHLTAAAPAAETLLVRAAERGDNLGSITSTLMQLLARYGAAELQAAVLEALTRGVPHPNAVRLVLERRREERHGLPPIAVILPEHVRAKDKPVRPHDLDAYDKLRDDSNED
jgi:Mu transposase-like protein